MDTIHKEMPQITDPIQTQTLTFERWIETPIKYETNYYIKDVLRCMCHNTYDWILSKEDISLSTDFESFSDEFNRSMFHGYTSHRDTNATSYFDLKYLEEISSLFTECHEIALHYDIGLELRHMDLHELLRDILLIYDPDDTPDPDDPTESDDINI
jgi:hypothetical protein